MTTHTTSAASRARGNVLGDLRAEADHGMLAPAFLETADYKSLIDTTDRPIVVGRRGTGKSALAYRLAKHWRETKRTEVIELAPTEEQVIGLRSLLPEFFSSKYNLIRAGTRNAWRYGLLMEAACQLSRHYKFHKTSHAALLQRHTRDWQPLGTELSMRLRKKLQLVGAHMDAASRIADIAGLLQLNAVQDAVAVTLDELDREAVFLIDRVDEGYEPDEVGVAMVDALVLAAIDINTRLDRVRVALFLRDNIARAVEQLDRDYSRDIEGQILRLHWEEAQLFSMVCNRLRIAFGIEAESDAKVWNRCTARGLQGREGFKSCLRLTLYRPRDILALLNDAFLSAAREERQQIIEEDVAKSAHRISQNRLGDLFKEYSAILPGLQTYVERFKQASPDMSVADAYGLVEFAFDDHSSDQAAVQTFALLNSAPEVASALYSVGFLGIKDATSGVVAFCHDGRHLDRTVSQTDRVMVHPCYWMALGLSQAEVDPIVGQEIFDDYDIRVVSQTPELRKAKLGRMIGALDRLPVGDESAADFEQWCLNAIQVIFAAQLTNITLHPNGSSIQRRDVVATNPARGDFWKRVLQDYRVRQAIFEVKNYKLIGPDEYRQMLSYLTGEYGTAGFIITRDDSENLLTDRELPWMKEMYTKHGRLIIKLTGKFLQRILSKMRSVQRHDEADVQLNKLVDLYTRNYLGEPVRRKQHRKTK